MKRHYLTLIQEYLSYFPCVVLIGARQTGKSTLIEMLQDGRTIFDLERRADFDQIARDPDLFFQLNNLPIAIDEAQQLPELFPALRVAIDKNRQQYGQYLLSGSSSPELLNSISESLAGRVAIIEIGPLSLSETMVSSCPNLLKIFSENCNIEALLQIESKQTIENANQNIDAYWLNGGYPEPWLRNSSRFTELWQAQYLKSFVERDIARLFPNINSVRFRRFIELLASYSGNIINYSNIAKILDISQPTAKDYFRIAHGTFIWRNIQPYTKNISKRVIKHPKGYLRDSGLLHHILQLPSNRRLLAHPQMGNSWEGMVIESILRVLDSAGIQYTPYFYRTSAGAEVDLIIESQYGLMPIEIKHSQNVSARQLRSLRDFVNEFSCEFGIVINRDEKIRQLDEKIIGIPLHMLVF